MYVDSQNIINIDLEKIEEYIKNVLKLIQDSSKQVINKITTKNKIVTEEINENKIKHNITLLFQEMNEISIALKMNDLFYDEYFEFCEIEDMIKYTLNRNLLILSESDLDFILNLVINFFYLIQFKVNLIKNNSFDEKKFEEKYEEYSSTLDEYKLYFFDNICNEKIDENTFRKYCNIIME